MHEWNAHICVLLFYSLQCWGITATFISQGEQAHQFMGPACQPMGPTYQVVGGTGQSALWDLSVRSAVGPTYQVICGIPC
jgi:hypothetical protein